jgi:hypothetical protein
VELEICSGKMKLGYRVVSLSNKELHVFEILDGLLYLLFSILNHPLNITQQKEDWG